MKILINLLSEQVAPNIIAVKHFKVDKVIALATKDHEWQVSNFELITKIPHELVSISAFKLDENFQLLNRVVDYFSENEVVINYTGGTKVMAMSVMLKTLLTVDGKISFVYINSAESLIEILTINENKTLTTENIKIKEYIYLEDYFRIKGESIDSYDNELNKSEIERLVLSKQLMKNNVYLSLFRKQNKFFANGMPLDKHRVTTSDKFDLYWDKGEIFLRQGSKVYQYNHSDGGRYFTGGWLEELVFSKLKQSGKFDRVIKNLKVDFKADLNKFNKNEIDIVVAKGVKSAFIECKAGSVKQEHVYKLKAITDYFLGSHGVPILVVRFKPQANIIEKCKDFGVHIITNVEYDYMDIEIERLLK
jgi:hypothetical protein